MTFAQAALLFLRRYEDHGNQQEIQEARSLLSEFLLPRFADTPVGEVTPQVLETYGQQLRFRMQRDFAPMVDREVEAVLRTARRVIATVSVPAPRAVCMLANPVPPDRICEVWSAMTLGWRLYGRLRLEAGLSHEEAANAHWLDFEEGLRVFQRGVFPMRAIPKPLATQLLYAEAMSDGGALFPDLMGCDEDRFDREAWQPALAAAGLAARSVKAVPETYAVRAIGQGTALTEVAFALGIDMDAFEARFGRWIQGEPAPADRHPQHQPR